MDFFSNFIGSQSNSRFTIGTRTIELRDLISEGGYAYVHRGQDASTGEVFAVKKIICQTPELLEMARREIQVMESLPPHENIVHYYGSLIYSEKNYHIALILMELCTEGTLVNLLERYNGVLSLEQILYIFKDIIRSVQMVHNAGYIHRDLKVENILLSNKKFKLCDFGSCTREVINLGAMSRQELLEHEEIFERQTTLMYRPPEMMDVYTKHTIDFKSDIWMLGCILYTLAFFKHPFQDQSNLAIMNAHYSFPANSRFNPKFHSLITYILNPNPTLRPDLNDVIRAIQNYDSVDTFVNEAPKPSPKKPKRIDRDLTPEEIQREIMLARQKNTQKVQPKKPQNVFEVPSNTQDLLGLGQKEESKQNFGWAKW